MNVKTFFKKNGATMWAGAAIGLTVGAVVESIIATVDAVKKIDEKKQAISEETGVPVEDVKLTKMEVVKTAAPSYVRTFIFLGGAVACECVSNCKHQIRYDGALNACMLSQAKAADMDKALDDVLGEKKAKEVKQQAAQNSAEANEEKISAGEVYSSYGNGTALFYIDYLGIYFRSDPSDVNKALEEFNAGCEYQSQTVDDLFRELGIDIYGDTFANVLGWNNGERAGAVSGLYKQKCAEPCSIITFKHNPHPDFY